MNVHIAILMSGISSVVLTCGYYELGEIAERIDGIILSTLYRFLAIVFVVLLLTLIVLPWLPTPLRTLFQTGGRDSVWCVLQMLIVALGFVVGAVMSVPKRSAYDR